MSEKEGCKYKALYSSTLYIFDVANKHSCDQNLFVSLAISKHQLRQESVRVETHSEEIGTHIQEMGFAPQNCLGSDTINRLLPLVARLGHGNTDYTD